MLYQIVVMFLISAMLTCGRILKCEQSKMQNQHTEKKEGSEDEDSFLWLLFISHTYAYVDESTLTGLQRLDHWNTFRIVISHTDDECFYVETKLNDTIHVVYQVLKGGDSYITARITDPAGNVTFTQSEKPFGWYSEERSKIPGVYQICFRNERYFSTKILYIGVLAVHAQRLMESALKALQEQKNNETAVLDRFSRSAMNTLNGMSSTLFQITAYQTVARVRHAHDMYSAEINANYVQKWAIYQIITMIICSIVQVFSIRRLFKSTIAKKTSSFSSKKPTLQPSDYLIIAN